MSDIYSKIQEQIMNRKTQNPSAEVNKIIACDQKVRQAISELYQMLSSVKDVDMSLSLLSEHAAMLIEMINEFKQRK